ncbi:MAG: hypothetical protein WBO09_16095 [Methylocystis silviterrae]|uniref:hypothetical protein n=1 Tax=Methylocystis silviterrae TaxID=2743612 RepID=UPI003C7771CF
MAHRVFKDKPSKFFCDDVTEFISKTGEPEKHPDLYTGRIDSNEEYEILRHIIIDGRKRPNADMAPCPMCSPNRFLEGDLVYLRNIKVAAVIGRCCAVHAAQAERQYKIEERKFYEETYLLEAFKFLASKRDTILAGRSVAEQVLKAYRTFRRDMTDLQARLRTIKERGNARLVLYEILRDEDSEKESDYYGPAGFRGRGDSSAESRDIDFGFLDGTTALLKNYQPVIELNDIDRNISFLNFKGDEEDAMNLIAAMTDAERRATVASLQLADSKYEKFSKRVQDCLDFFAPENIERLNKFGTHPLNHQPFKASISRGQRRRVVHFKEGRVSCSIILSENLYEFDYAWEMVPFKQG